MDFRTGVKSTSGPCAKWKQWFPDTLYKAADLWELNQSITRSQSNEISQLSKNQVNQQHKNKSTTTSQVIAAPWEAYKEQDRYVDTFGIGTSGISELRYRSLSRKALPWRARHLFTLVCERWRFPKPARSISASPSRKKRSRVNASASEQRRGTLRASRYFRRSQRTPSHRVDEPRRAVSAAIGFSSRRDWAQWIYPPL